MNENIEGLLSLSILILFVVIFYAGAAKKVVIYFDTKDLLISVGSFVTPLLIFGLLQRAEVGSTLSENIIRWIIIPLLALLCLYFLFLNFRNGIIHSRNITMGMVIGVFKIAFVILAFMVILAQFSDAKDRRRSFTDVIVAALVVGFAIWITSVLVNGKEVYRQKGWVLPVTT